MWQSVLGLPDSFVNMKKYAMIPEVTEKIERRFVFLFANSNAHFVGVEDFLWAYVYREIYFHVIQKSDFPVH